MFKVKTLTDVLVAIAIASGPAVMTAQTTAIPMPKHVVVVMEENHSYSEIIGSSQAPYINTLASEGALFTESFGVTHPSEPNYLALFSGSTQGVTNDSCPHTFYTGSLEIQLLGAGRTFTGYSEGLPKTGSFVCSSGEYVRKHVPWTFFSKGKPADNQPFANFPTDFSKLPTVAFVIPDLLDDMHNGTIQQADSWLQTNLLPYVTWARTNDGLLIIQFDEDDYSGNNHIATIFVGPMVKPGQYSENINHYNILRTMEDMYKLPYLSHASTAKPITDVWK